MDNSYPVIWYSATTSRKPYVQKSHDRIMFFCFPKSSVYFWLLPFCLETDDSPCVSGQSGRFGVLRYYAIFLNDHFYLPSSLIGCFKPTFIVLMRTILLEVQKSEWSPRATRDVIIETTLITCQHDTRVLVLKKIQIFSLEIDFETQRIKFGW